MNSSSLSWASYCSSALEFRPKEETDAKCFVELFVIFLSFQPNKKAGENALSCPDLGLVGLLTSKLGSKVRGAIWLVMGEFYGKFSIETLTFVWDVGHPLPLGHVSIFVGSSQGIQIHFFFFDK